MNTKLKNAEDFFELGNSLRDSGKLDDAIKNYKRAIALNPNHSIAHNDLGVLLIHLGKTNEAINNFLEILTQQFLPQLWRQFLRDGFIFVRLTSG